MNLFFINIHRNFRVFFQKFISEEIKNDEYQLRAGEGLVALSLLASLSTLFFALLYVHLNFVTAATIVLVGGFGMGLTPFILKFTRKLHIAREWFISSFFIMKLCLTYYLGGIESPMLPWFLLCPMISMALGGMRQGPIWGGIITFTVLTIFLLQTMTKNFFPAPAIVDQRLLQVISMLGLFIFSAIVIFFFRPVIHRGKKI